MRSWAWSPGRGHRASCLPRVPGIWLHSVNAAKVMIAIRVYLESWTGGLEDLDCQSQMLGLQSPGGGSPSRLWNS